METSCCINLGPVGTPQVFTDVVSVQAAKHSGVMAAQSVSSSGHCLALSPESSYLFSNPPGRRMMAHLVHFVCGVRHLSAPSGGRPIEFVFDDLPLLSYR